MAEKKRIEWLDISRGICMLFVMISHIEFCPAIFKTLFGPVFLSMFFFISGYLYSNKKNFIEYLKNKTKTLLIPFIIFGLFNIFLRQIITFNEKVGLLNELKNFVLQIGNEAGLWFIACLYVASILIYPINKYINNNKKYIFVITLLAIITILFNKYIGVCLPWHFQKVGIAIFFMGIGRLYKDKYENEFKKYENIVCLLFGIVFYIILLILNWKIFNNIYTSVNVYNTSIIMYILLSLISIWNMVLSVKIFIKNKFIKFVGENTLVYFAFHGKVQSLIMKISKNFIVLNNWNVFLYSIVITLLEAIILIIPAIIINKYFPWMLGRKKQV